MAGAVRQECLACAHHPRPVCDGSGVRLLRESGGRVVDVQVCVRWPASWDEPLAYWEALAEHGIDPIPATTVPEKVWPAVQAEMARVGRAPADGTAAEGQDAADAERETTGAMGVALVPVLAFLVVLVLVAVLVVRS